MAIKVFNDQSDPQAQVLPTQTAVLKQMLKAFGQQLRVGLPGYFVDYDYKSQKATVQPSFSNEYNDGSVSPMPMIYNVPVRWPSSSVSYDHHPLVKGDRCTLHFADKALDLWLASGATSQPDDNRTHHVADAWAEPGLRPFNEPLPVSNGDDRIIAMKNTQIRMKQNGHLQIFNGLNTSNSQELVLILNDMLQILREAVTPTCNGPQILHHALFDQIAARLKTFLEA